MRALAILIVILATSRAAHAQMPTSFGSWMHYEVSELHAIDESMTSSTDLVLAGARVGGFIGKRRVAYAASFDFAFGSTIGTLDDAVILPLELTAEATLGPLRLLARGRASFLGASDARQNGSPTMTWADEFDAMLAIRVGSNYDKFRLASGNGYFLGATYREMEGAKFIGIVLGHSVDMGSQMRERRYDYDGCPDCE